MKKRRLVYLYVSNGSAANDQIPAWKSTVQTQEHFALNFHTEGFAYLFQRFIEIGLFDEILVVIESNRSPGSMQFSKGISILVVPHIQTLWSFLRDDDLVWARGGWRTWWLFLDQWHALGRWLLFYRAASNRGAWEFWDIVLDDLRETTTWDTHGRFYFPILKPTNPELFYPMDGVDQVYDLCIGASHIHDKKGQWRILPILDAYREKYGHALKCVMPGSFHGGGETRALVNKIKDYDIETPGMISRFQMRRIYNQSKLFVHLGGAGQNDRGPLEAMACGTSIVLANEQYHTPVINSKHCPWSFHIDPEDPSVAAQQLYYALQLHSISLRQGTRNYFQATHGIDTLMDRYSFLFNLLHKNEQQDKQTVFDQLIAYHAQNAFLTL